MFDFSDIQRADVSIWFSVPEARDGSYLEDVNIDLTPALKKKYKSYFEALESQGFWVSNLDGSRAIEVKHPDIDTAQIAERIAAALESAGEKVKRRIGKGDFRLKFTEVQSFILA